MKQHGKEKSNQEVPIWGEEKRCYHRWQASRGRQVLINIKKGKAAGLWTQRRVNSGESPPLGWPQYNCAWQRESHQLSIPLSRCPTKVRPLSLHLLCQNLLWQFSTECPQEESQLHQCVLFPNSNACPCTVHIPGYVWAAPKKPQNIVHKLYNPRSRCCSTAGKPRHMAVFHSAILFYNVDREIPPCSFAGLLSVLWYLYYRCLYIIFIYQYCFH